METKNNKTADSIASYDGTIDVGTIHRIPRRRRYDSGICPKSQEKDAIKDTERSG